MVSKKFNNIVSLIFLILQVHNVMSFWGKMIFFKISKFKKDVQKIKKNLKIPIQLKNHTRYTLFLYDFTMT